jgi:hypothetical protein
VAVLSFVSFLSWFFLSLESVLSCDGSVVVGCEVVGLESVELGRFELESVLSEVLLSSVPLLVPDVLLLPLVSLDVLLVTVPNVLLVNAPTVLLVTVPNVLLNAPTVLLVTAPPDVLLVPADDPVHCCVVGTAADRVVTVGVVGLDKSTLTGVNADCVGFNTIC